jgi:hypothetical protein
MFIIVIIIIIIIIIIQPLIEVWNTWVQMATYFAFA